MTNVPSGGGVNDEESCAWAGAGDVWEIDVPPSQVAVNLKLPLSF